MEAEVEIYEKIVQEHRELLREVVPNVLGSRRVPEIDLAVIIEFARHAVEKRKNEIFVN